MAAVDSTVKGFFPLEVKGGEKKLREMRTISRHRSCSQPAFPVERAKNQTRVSDAERGGGQLRAQGGLVPTERAR